MARTQRVSSLVSTAQFLLLLWVYNKQGFKASARARWCETLIENVMKTMNDDKF